MTACRRTCCALFLLTYCVAAAANDFATDLDAVLRSAVESKAVPGVVAMIATRSGVPYRHATGFDPEAIFSIASMTKPITSVAVMQLVEAGKVKLDVPASTYLPQLAKTRVLEAGALRPPKSPITVRQLLSHTSGFAYEFMNRDLAEYVRQGKSASMMAGGDAFLAAPLVSDPETRWEYGISTDWLGRLVETVSGLSLERYFRENIFEPLGMRDSFFKVPAEKQSRLAVLYRRKADGSLEKQPPLPVPASDFYSGGGGLNSTAADYVRFCRAILSGGELDGRRILKNSSVAMMARNQIGELTVRPFSILWPQFGRDGSTLPGFLDKFGLGFAVNSKKTQNGRGASTMSWAGIFNTFFWIDREKKVCAVLLTHMSPFLDDGPRKLLEDFDRAVYAHLASLRR
jgi:CubicO group peptidase (beta-lactamase class C family)